MSKKAGLRSHPLAELAVDYSAFPAADSEAVALVDYSAAVAAAVCNSAGVLVLHYHRDYQASASGQR